MCLKAIVNRLFIRDTSIPSVLPTALTSEIRKGNLPVINTNNIFLRRGEICHYADHAIYQIWGYGGSQRGTNRKTGYITDIKGNLYITNKRVIFSSKETGVDKKLSDLSMVRTYANAIELQFGSRIYTFLLPDGTVAGKVINLLQ